MRKGGDEGAFGDAGVVPGHDAEQDDDGADVDKSKNQKSQPDGARSFFAGARFAGGDRDHFDPAEAVDSEGHGNERRPETFGKESALRVVLRSDASTEQQGRADYDKDDDGGELDHGEPELGASVGVNAAQIQDEQHAGEDNDPNIGTHAGEPRRHVSGGGDHLGADGEGQAHPVSGPGNESGEGVEVEVAVDAETPGGGMSAREFAESHGDGEVDECSDQKTQNSRRAGDFHSGAGAEKQAGSNGAADGDHGHLSGRKLVAEAFFVNLRRLGLRRHGAPYQRAGWFPKLARRGLTKIQRRMVVFNSASIAETAKPLIAV